MNIVFRPAIRQQVRLFRSSVILNDEIKFKLNRPRKGEQNYFLNGNFPIDKNGVLALPK